MSRLSEYIDSVFQTDEEQPKVDPALVAAFQQFIGGGQEEKAPQQRQAYNDATGNVEWQQYNPATDKWEWTGVVASRPPAAPGTNVVVQNEPVSSQGAYTAEEARAAIEADGGTVTKGASGSGVIVGTYPDGSTVTYDPILSRSGTVRFNPTYKPAPTAAAAGEAARPIMSTDAKTGIVSAIDPVSGDVIADYYRTPQGLKKVPNPAYKGSLTAPAKPPATAGATATAPTQTTLPTPNLVDPAASTGRDYKFPTAAGGEGFTAFDPETNTSYGESGSYINGPAALGLGFRGPMRATFTDDQEQQQSQFAQAANAAGLRTRAIASSRDYDPATRTQLKQSVQAFGGSGGFSRPTQLPQPEEFVVTAEQLAALANVAPPTTNPLQEDPLQPQPMAEGGMISTGPSNMGGGVERGLFKGRPALFRDGRFLRFDDGTEPWGMGTFTPMGVSVPAEDHFGSWFGALGIKGSGGGSSGYGSRTSLGLSSPFSQDAYSGSPYGSYVSNDFGGFGGGGGGRGGGRGRGRGGSMAQGGQLVTGMEPMTVTGDWTGNPYATIGEPNALNGGQPTREVLNVAPLEPSVPMQQVTPFSQLMELLMQPRRGRKPPPAKPAGSTMMGGGY